MSDRLLTRLLLGIALVFAFLNEIIPFSSAAPVCSRSLADSRAIRLKALSQLASDVSAPVSLHAALSAAWNTSQTDIKYVRITESGLNISANLGSITCSRGGAVFLDCQSWQAAPCTVHGLDIHLASRQCTLITRGIRLERCGSAGEGPCLSMSNCPLVALYNTEINVVGYDVTGILTPSTLLLDQSTITCTNCAAFPTFGADSLSADLASVQCVPANTCTADFKRILTIANSSQLAVAGFSFRRCHLSTPSSNCLSLLISRNITFSQCLFMVIAGDQPWLKTGPSSQLHINDGQVSFNSTGNSDDHSLLWPLPNHALLSNVTFDCMSLPQARCQLLDPNIVIESADHIQFTGMDFASCVSSHCLIVKSSKNVVIKRCRFSEAAFPFVWMWDSQWTIRDSQFLNLNTSTFAPSGVKRFWFPDLYRHDCHSGAITTTFVSTRSAVCTLSNVLFRNLTSRNDTVSNSWGLGGAIFALLTGNSTGTVLRIEQVSLQTTTSGGMGGGLFVAFDDYSADNLVVVKNSTFYNCSSGVRAGAMHTVHNGESTNNSLLVSDVTFEQCSSHIAAGAFNIFLRQNVTRVYPPAQRNFTGQVHLLRCNFLNNRVVLDASSVQVWSYLPYGESSLPLVLEDCYFANNHAKHGQGAVVTYEAPVTFQGRNVFVNNSNTAIFLTHTSMLVSGDLFFFNNSGTAYGGGIGLVENCFFYIAPGANVQFSGNTACKGPAAYINPGVQQGIGVVGDRHSVCSLLLADDVTLLTLNSSNISALAEISFSDGLPNSCPANPSQACDQQVCSEDVYITSLSDCIEAVVGNITAQRGGLPYNDLPAIDQLFLKLVGFDRTKSLHISTDASALKLNDTFRLAAYPGQELSLTGLEVTDQADVRTVASVYVTVVDPKIRQYITVTPELVLVQREGHQPPTVVVRIDPYHYNQTLHGRQSANIELKFTLVHSSFTVSKNATLQLRRCPPGFDISPKEEICYYVGSDGVKGSAVLTHDLQTGTIYLYRNHFGYYDNATNRIYTWICPLFYCECQFDPQSAFPGCVYQPLNSDAQCNQFRKGHLCGACRGNYTTRLFGTACRSCPFQHQVVGWIVLVIFIVGTTAACCLVLYYNIGISPELLGVLFFLQTCYYASEPGSPVTTNWVNARPDDNGYGSVIFNPCIGHDWQPLYSVVMNYSLVLIGAVVIAMVYLLTRCGLFQILATRSSLNGVWLIFLLTYTTSTDTMLKSARCIVAFPDGQRKFYYDGNLFCFNFGGSNDATWLGWGVLSMLLFLFILLPTPFLMVLLSRGYFKRMKQFGDIIESSYVVERRWWAGVDLLRRLVLAIIYYESTTSHIRQVSLAIMSFLLLVVHCLAMPYKKRWVNYSEAFVLFDFFILSVLGLDGNLDRVSSSSKSEIPGFIFLLLPLVYGAVLVVRQLRLRVRRKSRKLNEAGVNGVGAEEGCRSVFSAAIPRRPPVILSQQQQHMAKATDPHRLLVTDADACEDQSKPSASLATIADD